MTLDARLERDLLTVFAVELSSDGDEALSARFERSMAVAQAGTPSRLTAIRRRRTRRRAIAALAVAAALVGAGASPAVREAFDSWFGGDFASVWDLATPIDQSVTDGGYRVTLVRAYADPAGLYLALTAEDLEGRDVEELAVGGAVVTDDQGNEYPGYISFGDGSGDGQYAEGLARFQVPPEAAAPGVHHLTAIVPSLGVRANDPPDATPGFPYETLWSSVEGTWRFDFDLEFRDQLDAQPGVTASANGVDVVWTDLAVTPSAIEISLEVTGLEPTEKDWGWSFGGRIQHDGHDLEWFSEQGILDHGPRPQTIVFEMQEGREDLSGTWMITIDEFQTDVLDPDSDVTTEQLIVEGPWVLTFEGPPPG